MKMKCFLHIGTEKTATTTLQVFCAKNRGKLYELGYFYPKSVGDIDHRKLPVIAYNLNRRDDFTKKNLITTDELLAKYQKKVFNELRKEIDNIKDNKKIIFSSEDIQSRLTTITEVKRLRDIFYSLGITDITVVVYLRTPVDIVSSLYSTAVKVGSTAEKPPPPSDPYFRNICHHKNTLERFESVFGKENIVPKIFSRKEFKNGSIIDDFLEIIGVQDSDQFDIPKPTNKSLSPLGIELLRRINKRIPVFINNQPNKLRGDLVLYFELYFERFLGGKKYMMPKDLYEQYVLYFEDSNEWVRRNYFPNRPILFEKRTNIKESKVIIPQFLLDLMAFIISKIWMYKRYKELDKS